MKFSAAPTLRTIFGLSLLALLSACSTTYRFKVDAIKNPDTTEPKSSYRIISGNPEMDEEDLRFKEAGNYVKTALSSKGMYEAPPGTEAEMSVEVDFGIEEPRTKLMTVSEPVYAMVGGGPPREILVTVRDPKTGQTRVERRVVYDPPRQELIGYQERVVSITVYEKYIRITARETPDEAGDRPPKELWSVYVSNEDENDNLREYIPLMVSAAMDSVNENGSAAKEVVLNDKDERVAFVKKGM